MSSKLDVKQIGDRFFELWLGEDMVRIAGSDDMSSDEIIERGLVMLGAATDQELIPAREGALVIDIPKFNASAKASSPAKTAKKG
jgi:hypothetical protein